MAAFVLTHSPLVGPLTWRPVADRLKRGGLPAYVPVLLSEGMQPPYWVHHASAIAESSGSSWPSVPVVLVAHSGAGPLLPPAREKIKHAVAGYVFVDASLPGRDKASRFDLFDSREDVELFRARAKGGLLPVWTELVGLDKDRLTTLIPNRALRRRFVAELRPIPLAVYEEPLPVFSGWPDAPCGYLRFSEAYGPTVERVRKSGWSCLELAGGHFHMLVRPAAVARALVDLVKQMHVNDS